ncbi:MAG TPA: M56 family metallopeptidase [Bryobacteraceae bacterium]|nr:M56 family metallopeptidase [Bryobacteraceae bacterium]
MTSDLWFANLVAWWLQAGVMAAVTALLLRAIPVRSPRAVMAYLQALLVVCLLLPVLEPWRSASVTSRISAGVASTLHVSTLGAVPVSISRVMLVLLAAGVAVRLIWLAMGCWKLRRYRFEAWSVGEEIAPLQKKLGVRAEVGVSSEILVPVTFGFRRPTVLLPARWCDLDSASRTAIVCHELLHVRGNDWAFHLAEEIIRAMVWFHPAIWWLIVEIRLAREQVVDRQVVGLTGAPKSYAEVLLAFAGIDSAVTAPAFAHKRHLARRIKYVLEEVTMTKSRLLVSFASITLCLMAAGAVAVWSFPLESVQSNLIVQDDSAPTTGIVGGVIGGVPGGVSGGVIGGVVGGVPGVRTVAAKPQSPGIYKVGNGVSAPKVVHKVDPEYTKEARDAKIEGTVVLQTEIHTDGRAHNISVVRSLDPGLDHNAIDAISQWEFEPGKKDGKSVAVAATIEVNYKLN